jgi:D-alanyl-lipoteichoic acid acyltransferase DltB (MBOAT superfamily)
LVSFLNPGFWIASLGLVILLPLSPVKRSLWFGGLNLLVVGCWLGPAPAIAAVFFSIAVWLGLRFARSASDRNRSKGVWFFGVLLALVFLFVLHEINLEHANFTQPLWKTTSGKIPGMVLRLLGLLSFSYVTLRAIDMTFAVLRDGQQLLDPLSCLGFLFPFHMLLSGPICSYSDYLTINNAKEMEWPNTERILIAANYIVTGLLYKYVISEYMRVFAYGAYGKISVDSLYDTAYLLIYVFFDFAGYSLVALGIGAIIGVPTPRNFNAPFISKTVTEFYTRWHISLGSFIQRNIYSPMLISLVRRWGRHRAFWAGFLTLLLSWIIVAVWHRMSLQLFFCWGGGMAILISIEKYVRDKMLRHPIFKSRLVHAVWTVMGPVYVFAAVVLMLHPIMRELLPK